MRTSESCSAQIFRSEPGMPSGPVAFLSFMFWSNLSTPCLLTEMLVILFRFCGRLVPERSFGVGSGFMLGEENTLQNWVLKASAFAFGSMTHVLSWNRSQVPDCSLRWVPMYFQNFLLLSSEVKRSAT